MPSERRQAEYEVRFCTILLANGVEKIFFHAGIGSAVNHGNVWKMFLRYGGEPYKCYASQAVMAQLLTPDCRFVKRLLPDEPVKAYLFGDGKRTVGVFGRRPARSQERSGSQTPSCNSGTSWAGRTRLRPSCPAKARCISSATAFRRKSSRRPWRWKRRSKAAGNVAEILPEL